MEPETYFIFGRNTEDAAVRLSGIAKIAREQIVELRPESDPSRSQLERPYKGPDCSIVQ